MDLKVDPSRANFPETGIYVRAQDEVGAWQSADIAHLNADSLLAFLRSDGGHNQLAENVVGMLLGHDGHIAEIGD